ncbi:hypothetical protein ACNJYD_19760 [Bradyrhizobium sp. DASA03005]|uniref:hypothetical protein n=1 Tax=Bradyrhizobium sp. SPXBL-02 TaxID=3395912 RepID=UPI003F700E61
MLLTACDPGSSEVVVKFICPRINEYDAATQDRALRELQALPKDSALRLFVGDYKHLRDQIRVCRERAGAASADPRR